ncbi:MAG: EAL domain-containing protein [Actinobacteria bacterium]|nr:EAL domain-containing protein [Actinomycetota bacterium]
MVPDLADAGEGRSVADALIDRLGEPFAVSGLELGVGAAFGVAVGPDHGDDPVTLLQRADIAMYTAKAHGDGSAQLFSAELVTAGTRRLRLAGEIRTALDEGLLDVHFQPIADLRSGKVVSAEALVRWHHSEHGWVPPPDIVGLAEHLGLLRQLTLFVLRSAVRQCATWRDSDFDVQVSVNLAAQSLIDVGLVSDVQRELRDAGLDPGRLVLEITETQVIRDPDQALQVLRGLSEIGITLAVDDFGTGFSSLSYLTRLPVNEIKIDRSFVANMLSDDTSAKVVRSIVELGKSLGRVVVAEGIEDLVTWDVLAAMGCDRGQGYHLSRPLNAERLTPWLTGRARPLPAPSPAAPVVSRPEDRPPHSSSPSRSTAH